MAAEARNEWFYQRGGKKHGPVGLDALGDLLERGEVAWTDLVWGDGFSDWVPANRASPLYFLQDMDGLLSGDQQNPDIKPTSRGVFRVRCRCGVRLRVPEEAKSRRLRCPKCASPVNVEETSGDQSQHASLSRHEQSLRRSSRTKEIMLWSAVALFVAASLGFVWWLLDENNKYRRRLADERCAATIANAKEWLTTTGTADRETGKRLKQELGAAITEYVSDPKTGQDVVTSLQNRLDEIDAKKAAEQVFAKGKTYLDDGKVEDALAAFRDYATNPAAAHRDKCEEWLAQIRNATDEQTIREWLDRQDDVALRGIKDNGGKAFGGVSHPVLLSRQGELATFLAGQILNNRKERTAQIQAEAEQQARAAKAKASMQSAWERRKDRLGECVVPLVSRTNRQQLAAAGAEFLTWMMTQKNHEPAAVQKAIDSFNQHIQPIVDSGDAAQLAMALGKFSPTDISILDDAIENSIWGRIPASLTKSQGQAWLQAWESAFLTGTMIKENPPSPPKPKEPLVFLNDQRTPRTRAEMENINRRTLAKAGQQLKAAAAQGAERAIMMNQAANFLADFAVVFQSGRRELVVKNVERVGPQLENGIQLLLNQTEFGNLLLIISANQDEVRYLTYSEMWDRAHEMQFR